MLINNARIDQYTISTWNADSHPYNPMSFVTVPGDFPGERPMGISQPVDLRIALFIKRTIESGRIGRIFLRNSILISDLTTNGGEFALSDTGMFNGLLDDALTAGALASNFEGGSGQPKLAILGETGLTREIQDFVVGGVAFIKLNHKYFDRT
jgi:hypothetical protein